MRWGYKELQTGYKRLQGVTKNTESYGGGVRRVTRSHKGLQGVREGYNKLQGVTRGDKGLQRVRTGDRRLQGVTGGYRG